MDGPNITDWITAIGTRVVPAIVPCIYKSLTKPKLTLSKNIDPSGDDRYLRLKVQNKRRTVAKKCMGRLVEIKDSEGKTLDYPQLNFCWERHNQLNLPHPVDIHKIPFAKHLDIAKHDTHDGKFYLRVDAENQQLAMGSYNSKLRLLCIPTQTYYVLVSVFTEDGFSESDWYVLRLSEGQYTIEKEKPPEQKS